MEDETLRNLGFASKQSNLGTGAETRRASLITGAGNVSTVSFHTYFPELKTDN